MTKLTEVEVVTFYEKSKAKSIHNFKKKRYNAALEDALYAGHLARYYPILPNYIDEELEGVMKSSFDGYCKKRDFKSIPKRVVFYNSQISNRGALTQQYLTFLIENDYEILFIVPELRKTVFGNDIVNQIQKQDKVQLFIPRQGSYTQKIRSIYNKICDFAPELCFIQLIPEEIVGFSVFANLENVRRYYIVHNDHTFWFGKNCADFFIEFREFGANITTQRRGIPKEKVVINNFYPITSGEHFDGFSIETKGKVIGLVAGSLYKILMDKEYLLLNILRDILNENENFILFIAGGQSVELSNYIENNNLQERIVLIGHRSDFLGLMKNIDIYINTFPLLGGLTTQFAAIAGKPIITLTKNEIYSVNAAEGLLKESKIKLTYTDINSFIERLSTLIKEEEIRKEFQDINLIAPFKKSDFNNKLSAILKDPTKFTTNKVNITRPLKHDDSFFLHYYLGIFRDLKKDRFKLKIINMVKRFGFGYLLK